MARRIEVLKINRSFVKTAKGGYNKIEVAYKDEEGKTKGMNVMDFSQREVFAQLKDVNDGDTLEVELEKNDKDFWQFKSISKSAKLAGEQTVSKGSSTGASKSNWETSEERAARQVMIVRQSSLSTAVAHKPKASTDEIIATAKQFEDFVMGNPGVPAKAVARGDVE